VAFLLVAIVVILAPGPDFALTVRNTIAGGRRAGTLTSLGVFSGQLVWELAAAAGLTALLVASHPAFVALRVLGAASQFGASFATLIVHGLPFSLLTLLWLTFVVVAGAALVAPPVRRALDAVTGVVLVAFGVRLATEHR
jgi:threonine/homoserine/homoserine lactone efflux protein